MLKLHLILPNAAKKNPSSREVTTDNFQECFSLMKETALFEFGALRFGHMVADEESIQQGLGIYIYIEISYFIIMFWQFSLLFITIITLQILMTLESY